MHLDKSMQIYPNVPPRMFHLYHINCIPMFQAYTTEELRIYDYIYEGKPLNPNFEEKNTSYGYSSPFQSTNYNSFNFQQVNHSQFDYQTNSTLPTYNINTYLRESSTDNHMPDPKQNTQQPYNYQPDIEYSYPDYEVSLNEEINYQPPIRLKGFNQPYSS